MDEKKIENEGKPAGQSAPSRFVRWLDRRTGINHLLQVSLDEPIPGGARLAYVFGSGLLFIFISQIITGICLALYYVPSAETAHTSVAYITKQVAAGAFLRSLHYYGSSAMVVVLFLHFLQTFLYGSFKGRRELLWISGAVLSLLVLAMGFTGYLLPWDQKAYFATAVGTNIVSQIPLLGTWLTKLLRGGDTIGTLTLSRFYVAHVFLIPGAIFAFIAAHIMLFRKAGPAGPINEDPVHPKLPPEGFYPRQVVMDMAFALLLMAGLGVLAYFHPAELGPLANPADTHFLPRPEWYYFPFFEWLKFWEGPKVVFAVVITPAVLALLFFLVPFLDRSLERRPWRRPIPLLAVSIVVLGIIYLGIKSHLDDMRDPGVAAQLAVQAQQEEAYSKAPFHPYVESPGTSSPLLPTGPVDPLVAQGKGLFESNGCSGCHGDVGTGGPAGPSLAGITAKYSAADLSALLHNPSAKLRAGGMPAFDLSPGDTHALLTFLGVIGTPAANVPAAHNAVQPGSSSRGTSEKAAAVESHPADAPETEASSVAAGRQMFAAKACFACHGQAGAGTAMVPPMGRLIAGHSDQQLAQLLEHPDQKMKAGGMPPLTGTQEEISAMVAYLRTLPAPGKAVAPKAAAGSAAVPDPAPAPEEKAGQSAPPSAAAAPQAATAAAPAGAPDTSAGRAVFVANGCAACHGQNGTGTQFAPSLVGITHKFPEPQLTALLRHPSKAMRDGGMPTVTVSDAELRQLIGYLGSLGTQQPAASKAAQNQGAAATSAAAARPEPSAAHPPSQPPPPLSVEAKRGSVIFQHYSCQGCHGVGGLHGTVAAPGLAGTASILPAPMLENLLRHHSARMQEGGMPLTNLKPNDMKALVAYIRSLPSNGGTQ
ncbi:MAG TPA: cytochrome b N-terminal domain-containing protein [Acidobacteriaceae bacterium]|nr:cytochrome b N-terminal domain-containing protein [Acidobacteriaceae bacterium]